MSEAPPKEGDAQEEGDWRLLALKAMASNYMLQSELRDVKRELEKTHHEFESFKRTYGPDPKRI